MSSEATVSVLSILSACYELASAAGELIRTIFASGDLKTVDKSNPSSASSSNALVIDDPQTVADLRSQRMLVGSLRRLWPALTIVGEEGDLEIPPSAPVAARTNLFDQHLPKVPLELLQVPLSDIVVWIDPLDGTREYTLGEVEAVTVLLGVSVRGRAVGGVVHVPFSQPPQTWWGMVGLGAFLWADSAAIPAVPANRTIIATSRSHLTPSLQQQLAQLAPDKVIYVGGAGHKSLLVIKGIADVYFFPQQGTKRWDTCAVDALLHAADFQMTDAFGEAIDYSVPSDRNFENEKGVIASRHNHSRFLLAKDAQRVPPFSGRSGPLGDAPKL